MLEKLKGKNYLVLGRVGMDMYAAEHGRTLEEGGAFHSAIGGSSANIAVGLCKLGVRASLVTVVSDDAIGRFCLKGLAQYGVDTDYIRTEGGELRTSLAIYETRNENFQNVIYRNGAADFTMNNSDIDAIDFSNFSALITTGTVFAAEPSRSAAFYAFEKARQAGVPIIFDIDYRPYSWTSAQEASDVLSAAGEASDMIIGNDEEFGFMAGDYDAGYQKACDLSAGQKRICIYKMGPLGAVSMCYGEEIRTGIYKVDALKPVGAGDSFMAGLMASLSDGFDFKQAVLRGSAYASITVSKAGCSVAMASKAELGEFLLTHEGASHV